MLDCIKEDNIDYHDGESNNILYQEGLTWQKCANLAAATDGGNFWTHKAHLSKDDDQSPSGCWVRKTNKKKIPNITGLKSGNRACGVPSKYSAKHRNLNS